MEYRPPSIIPVASLASMESMLSSPTGVVVAASGHGQPTVTRMAAQPLVGEPQETPIPLMGSQSVELLPSPGAPVPTQGPGVELAGEELLRSVFDTMAVNGKITMDQLPFVLAGAEVEATAEQIHEAIEKYLPDADEGDALLDFAQVQTVYHQLAQVVMDAGGLPEGGPERRPSAVRRLWRWLQRKRTERRLRQTAYERHMKPTTRLLLLILLTSCAISTAVVVFAVFFIFDHSNNDVIDHLVRGTELLSDGMNLFGYTRPLERTTSNFQRLATILSAVVEELGYESSLAYQLANLANQQTLLGGLLEGWYVNDALSTVDLGVTVLALWVERMVARGTTLASFAAAFDTMNPTLPDGEEVQLARAGPGGQLQFLTAFRYPCAGVCGANNGSTAVRLALAGNNGTTLAGTDYRPQPVAAGYRLLANPAGVALVYYTAQATLRAAFQPPAKVVIDAINAQLAVEVSSTSPNVRVNSQEIVLSSRQSGTTQNVTALRFCNASCVKAANLDNSYLALGTNSTGQGLATDLDGEAVLVAYGPLPASMLGLEVKVTQEEFLDALYVSLGQSLNDVNSKLTGTQELQMVTKPKAGVNVSTNGMQYWSTFRFPATCKPTCGQAPNTSMYLQTALASCVSGTAHSLDYRSQMVIAGYFCVSDMKAAVAITMADSQLITDGINMAVAIANYQTMVRYAQTSTEIAIVQKKPGVVVATLRSQYTRLNARKYSCPDNRCTGPAVAVQDAVNGASGYVQGLDYRWVDCMTAYTYIASLGLGIVVKMDTSEAQAGTFRLVGILCGASVSAVIFTMAVLALLANVLLRSMDRAWEEGKRAIEREKQAFRAVIEAMYPAEVAQRMLTGETHVAYDVPAATVFFSDIFEFTTTSNTVTPEELIRFMGYTFGTMDAIGDYYHVYKVKTIGDAYLGVTGLPGMASVNGSSVMDMLLFASACAQVFSNRFLHPDEGTILAEVVTRVLRKKNLLRRRSVSPEGKAAALPRRPSVIGYGLPREAEDGSKAGGPLVHCIMRYGLAMGPITAGVLEGKTPLFDIWGKTVNLASRMESTGQAGRIQVSEGVFQAVRKHKNQPFTFESRHKVFCKGFGHVHAYFVSTCVVAPPKDLLRALHIEPNWGSYLFHDPAPRSAAAAAVAAPGPADPSRRSSTSGAQSRSASTTSKG